MRVQKIDYTQANFCAQKRNVKNNTAIQQRPVMDALNTAGIWFGFGVGLDLVSRKLSFFKSPMKNSLLINGVIGTTAGAVTGYKELNKKA